MVIEWSLKLFPSEEKCFDDQMREFVKFKNTIHVQVITRSDFRRKCKQVSILDPLLRGYLTESPQCQHPSLFPISLPLELGSVLELKGLTVSGAQGYSGNVSTLLGAKYFGRQGWESFHILQKCLYGQMCSKCRNPRELWEHIKSTLLCIKGNITIVLLSSC